MTQCPRISISNLRRHAHRPHVQLPGTNVVGQASAGSRGVLGGLQYGTEVGVHAACSLQGNTTWNVLCLEGEISCLLATPCARSARISLRSRSETKLFPSTIEVDRITENLDSLGKGKGKGVSKAISTRRLDFCQGACKSPSFLASSRQYLQSTPKRLVTGCRSPRCSDSSSFEPEAR